MSMDKSQPYYGSYDTQYPPPYPPPYPKEDQTPRTFGLSTLDAAYSPPKYSWFEEVQRNKPQSNSLGAALFIFISGGMSLAWSIGFTPIFGKMSKGTQIHMQICWFVAVILGAIAATILIDKIKKRTFNFIASALVLINGILFLSDAAGVTSITIARYCDGIAFGLTVIPAITAGSEQSVKHLRGLVLSLESVGLSIGIMLQTIYFNMWEYGASFSSTQMHGALATLYGVLAFIFACFLTIESPSFYLRRNQDTEAIECLRKLQKPRIVTTETYSLFYENKRLLEEDQARGMSVNLRRGWSPLVKVCLFRVLVSMSISLPITLTLVEASQGLNGTDYLLPVILYGTMRSLGTTVAIFSLDSLGRKFPAAIGMIICGGLMTGVGAIYASNILDPSFSEIETIIALLITYQFIAGLVAASSTTYLGEAFSISVKPYFILISLIVESIVQIIICCTYDVKNNIITVFSLILGTLQVLFGFVIFISMPETKKTTLREALCMFKGVLNME